jgi:hypothetical protein
MTLRHCCMIAKHPLSHRPADILVQREAEVGGAASVAVEVYVPFPRPHRYQ